MTSATERPTPGGRASGESATDGPVEPRPRRALEAPHRRVASAPRILERTTVLAYRGTGWVVGHLPPRLAWTVIGWLAQASYLLWPQKRRWSNRNFGHVLGLAPDDPAVRRLALRAYRSYARYLVEIMRLPSMTKDEAAAMLDPEGVEEVERIWRGSDGIIFAACHVGNNEAISAGIGSRGWPLSGLADDSTFPELFDQLKRERERFGAKVIPWRNLREVYAVLRRHEMLALLIDWGYRSDGVPVRLFGAWTTLPAGPATLAGKTGALILPVVARRTTGGRFLATVDTPIRVPSTRPADVLAGTQAMADRARAGHRGRARPVVQLQADLAGDRGRGGRARGPGGGDGRRRRSACSHGGRSAVTSGAASPVTGSAPRGSLRQRAAAAGLSAVSWVACRIPERIALRLADLAGALWYRSDRRPGRSRPAEPRPGRPMAHRAGDGRCPDPCGGDRPAGPRATRPVGLPVLRALLPRRRPRPVVPAGLPRCPASGRDARQLRGGVRGAGAAHLHRAPLRGDRAPGVRRRGADPDGADHADGDHRRPRAPALFRPDAGGDRASASSGCARRAARSRRPWPAASTWGSSPTAT